jgi:hypothetical protein
MSDPCAPRVTRSSLKAGLIGSAIVSILIAIIVWIVF